MKRRWLSALAFGLSLKGAALAGGIQGPAAWLGNRVDVARTAFCRANGCKLERQFTPMGWPEGIGYAYRLRDGWTLETYVQPDGWISNVFLLKDQVRRGTSLTLQERRLSAEFLKMVTGRHFTPEAVASCISAGLTAQKRDPDVYGPNFPLGHSGRFALQGPLWCRGCWAAGRLGWVDAAVNFLLILSSLPTPYPGPYGHSA